MKRKLLFLICPFVFLGLEGNVWAQQTVVPAGTLLRCTLNEPNFSSATAEVGDPVICHADAMQQFGREIFPRGTYLTGRLEGYKDPGHFFGKGWLQLEFDRIVLPNTDLPVPGKIIAVRGYRVEREGKIRGHGHAKRDAIEWIFPPLWPWKALTLPAEGPRPTLKGEVPITLRLMEDVTVPQASAALPRASRQPTAESFTMPLSMPKSIPSIRYVPPNTPVMQNSAGIGLLRPGSSAATDPGSADMEGLRTASSWHRFGQTVEGSNSGLDHRPAALTLIALKSETIYAVSDYWFDNGHLSYVLSSGTEQMVDINEVDWRRTTQLNAELGVTLTLRSARHAN